MAWATEAIASANVTMAILIMDAPPFSLLITILQKNYVGC
jgi:hypothetical protein